jgi:ubiquinone biosynthesis protein
VLIIKNTKNTKNTGNYKRRIPAANCLAERRLAMADAGMNRMALLGKLMAVMAADAGKPPSRAVVRRRMIELLRTAKAEGEYFTIVSTVVMFAGIADLLPQRYAKFNATVVEGTIFIISSLPLARVADKIVDQLFLDPVTPPGKRLFTLVEDMPSLQKLGQVICRDPDIDPEFKKVLIDLEDNIVTLTFPKLKGMLEKEIAGIRRPCTIIPEKRILAEASVCAVIPANVELEDGTHYSAVLKLVKPAVRNNLPGELALLERLADFLDSRRKDWELGVFNFRGTLDRVKHLLENEVNLAMEQKNMERVRSYYAGNRSVIIPYGLPVSTATMTVMTRIEGRKITDVAGLTDRQRRSLAERVTRLCILKPIQDLNEETIFHGDPHAGNIAYIFDGDHPAIIFYDWGTMGKLTLIDRFGLVGVSLGLIMGNRQVVFWAADVVTKGQLSSDKERSPVLMKLIDEAIAGMSGKAGGVLATLETLFERFTYNGVVFSADLMLYQKAMLTLKGVIADVCPGFDRGDYLLRSAMLTFLNDIMKLKIFKMIMEDAGGVYQTGMALFYHLQKSLFRFLH